MITQVLHRPEQNQTLAVESPPLKELLDSVTSGYMDLRYAITKVHKKDKYTKKIGRELVLERLVASPVISVKIMYIKITGSYITSLINLPSGEYVKLVGRIDKPLLRLTRL